MSVNKSKHRKGKDFKVEQKWLTASSSGGASVPAAERRISCSFPPSSCSRLGRWCWQQGQLWHGNRSVCVCVWCLLPSSSSWILIIFTHISLQGKQEDSSSQETWWLWWRAGSQDPVTPTSWGQWAPSIYAFLPDPKSDPPSALGRLYGECNWWMLFSLQHCRSWWYYEETCTGEAGLMYDEWLLQIKLEAWTAAVLSLLSGS